MSLKRMITKVALAFAAKKGVEMFQNAGGIDGIRKSLASGPNSAAPGAGATSRGATGGITDIFDRLGLNTSGSSPSSAQSNPQMGSLGALLGSLSSVMGQSANPQKVEQLTRLDRDAQSPLGQNEGRAVIRAMVQTARADGHIDESEREALMELMNDADPSERSLLTDALAEPINAQAVADDTPAHAAMDVYAAALVVASDNNAAEQQYLSDLASALKLSFDDQIDLHNAMDKKAGRAA